MQQQQQHPRLHLWPPPAPLCQCTTTGLLTVFIGDRQVEKGSHKFACAFIYIYIYIYFHTYLYNISSQISSALRLANSRQRSFVEDCVEKS